MLRATLIVILLVVTHGIKAQKSGAANHASRPENADIIWIQKILDNWHYACVNELKIKVKPLPWTIFYDSSAAWHLNADKSTLGSFEKTQDSVAFAGINYQIIRVSHKAGIWVPDRSHVPLASLILSTMPYAQNKKAFFIAPLPSLFHKLAAPDQAAYLDFIFLGTTIHELTHTRQLPFVLPQLLEFQKKSKRESLDDNTVENEFSKNERYKNLFFEENKHLWNAVFAGDSDSCIAEIEKAFNLQEIRTREFFTGDNLQLGKADEIFLSLEGSAMWAQYRVMHKNTPNPIDRELLAWLVQQAPAWSQERGLVLFLLIERFKPEWKDDFFEKELPVTTEYLRKIVDQRKKWGLIGDFLMNAIDTARKKKYDEAIVIVDSAIAVDSNDENIYVLKAELLWMKGDFHQAAINYQKWITLDKDSSFLFGAFVMLGVLYEKAGKLEKAKSNYLKAVYLFENVKRKDDRLFELSNRTDYAIALMLSGNHKKWDQIKVDQFYSGFREKYNGKSRAEIIEIYFAPFKGD